MARYLHTMVRVTDPERSRAFYEALGMEFKRELPIVRDGELEATNYFFAFPGDKAADTRVFSSPTDAFAVYSKTKNKAAALRLVDYWATPAAQGAYGKATGAASMYQAGTGRHLAFELRGIAPLLRQKDKVHTLMQVEWSNPAVFETLGKDVQGLLTGQKTVAATLAGLQAAGAWDADIAWWALLVATLLTWISGLDYARVAPSVLRGERTAS